MMNNGGMFLLSVFNLLQSGWFFFPFSKPSHLLALCMLKKILVHLKTSKSLQ